MVSFYFYAILHDHKVDFLSWRPFIDARRGFSFSNNFVKPRQQRNKKLFEFSWIKLFLYKTCAFSLNILWMRRSFLSLPRQIASHCVSNILSVQSAYPLLPFNCFVVKYWNYIFMFRAFRSQLRMFTLTLIRFSSPPRKEASFHDMSTKCHFNSRFFPFTLLFRWNVIVILHFTHIFNFPGRFLRISWNFCEFHLMLPLLSIQEPSWVAFK